MGGILVAIFPRDLLVYHNSLKSQEERLSEPGAGGGHTVPLRATKYGAAVMA
jgi:hypothetical protein